MKSERPQQTKEIVLNPEDQHFFEKLLRAIDTMPFVLQHYKHRFLILVAPVAAFINLLLIFDFFFRWHYTDIFCVGKRTGLVGNKRNKQQNRSVLQKTKHVNLKEKQVLFTSS
jgi:hypothetical protein